MIRDGYHKNGNFAFVHESFELIIFDKKHFNRIKDLFRSTLFVFEFWLRPCHVCSCILPISPKKVPKTTRERITYAIVSNIICAHCILLPPPPLGKALLIMVHKVINFQHVQTPR